MSSRRRQTYMKKLKDFTSSQLPESGPINYSVEEELIKRSIISDTRVMGDAYSIILNQRKQIQAYQNILIEILESTDPKEDVDLQLRLSNMVSRMKV
jgi:hypothetical protein